MDHNGPCRHHCYRLTIVPNKSWIHVESYHPERNEKFERIRHVSVIYLIEPHLISLHRMASNGVDFLCLAQVSRTPSVVETFLFSTDFVSFRHEKELISSLSVTSESDHGLICIVHVLRIKTNIRFASTSNLQKTKETCSSTYYTQEKYRSPRRKRDFHQARIVQGKYYPRTIWTIYIGGVHEFSIDLTHHHNHPKDKFPAHSSVSSSFNPTRSKLMRS